MEIKYKKLIDYIEYTGGKHSIIEHKERTNNNPSILDYQGMKEKYLGSTLYGYCVDEKYYPLMDVSSIDDKILYKMTPLNKGKHKELSFFLPDIITLYKELVELFEEHKKWMSYSNQILTTPKCLSEIYNSNVMFKCDYTPNGCCGRDSLKCGIVLFDRNVEIKMNFHNFNTYLLDQTSDYLGEDPSFWIETRSTTGTIKNLNREWNYVNTGVYSLKLKTKEQQERFDKLKGGIRLPEPFIDLIYW